jgi:peptidoglycan hydrolase CwlO-like protein
VIIAELGEGWVAGLGAILLSLVSAVVAAWAGILKQKADAKSKEAQDKQTETDYLFKEYKDQLKEVKAQSWEDRKIMVGLQEEHTHCREELAASKERLAAQDIRIAAQDQRIAAQDARIKHLEALLGGKSDEPTDTVTHR